MRTCKVLIPLDGSPFSQKIVPHACNLLNPEGTEIILLRVVPMPEGHIGQPPRLISPIWPLPMYLSARDAEEAAHPIYASQEQASLEAMLVDELLGEVHRIQDAGYEVSVAVRFGDAAEEIVAFVQSEHISLVAMATHGRSGLSRMLVGSVAEVALRSLSVPLLLVRPFMAHAHEEFYHTDELQHTSATSSEA